MRILINFSTLKKGGGVQVAISLLEEIRNNNKHDFIVVISDLVRQQIDTIEFPTNFIFYNYTMSPSLAMAITGHNEFLSRIEKRYCPDSIFTLFGPAYWSPTSKHIVGFADGWCYYPETSAFEELSPLAKLKTKAIIWIKKSRIKKEADLLIVETEDARERISLQFKIPAGRILVIGNTFNGYFESQDTADFKIDERLEKEFRLVTISANYPHKNLKIIKDIIPLLIMKGINPKFYITIDQKDFNKMFRGSEDYIKNLGPIDVKYCPSVYKQCDAMFLPTLLETFSASYPEAMKAGLPILTSDLPFARNICKDAAVYFNPRDPQNISEQIAIVANNQAKRNELVEKGFTRLLEFETPASRAIKYLTLCTS